MLAKGFFYLFVFRFILLFIYLFCLFLAASGLQSWHAASSLRHAGSFIAARGLFMTVHRLLSSCGVRVFLFSSCGVWVPERVSSVVEVHELSSCGAQAQLTRSMCYLCSLTRDRTCVPCIVRQILYHWTTREVPGQKVLIERDVCQGHVRALKASGRFAI